LKPFYDKMGDGDIDEMKTPQAMPIEISDSIDSINLLLLLLLESWHISIYISNAYSDPPPMGGNVQQSQKNKPQLSDHVASFLASIPIAMAAKSLSEVIVHIFSYMHHPLWSMDTQIITVFFFFNFT
jgi:hypothetical protein